MGQLDADALEREGWSLCRTFQKDKDTMVYEVKKPSDFPTIEERKKGKSIVKSTGYRGYWACNQCGTEIKCTDNYCRHCGADLRGEQQ